MSNDPEQAGASPGAEVIRLAVVNAREVSAAGGGGQGPRPPPPPGDQPPHDEQPALPPEYSDDALVMVFIERHGRDLLYVEEVGKWFLWDGRRYVEDATLAVRDLVRQVLRDVAAACDKPSIARSIASEKTVSAVERLARSDRQVATEVEELDSHPFLFNTPGGTVELRTGETRPARREDLMTKIAGAAPASLNMDDRLGECPLFAKFLERILPDAQVRAYMLRFLGYALTGSTREHVLVLAYGTGANGKSVLFNTISGIMGDYALSSPIETFTISQGDRHPTELARLRGARLVTSSETEEGKRLAESRVKQMTGGDKVSARRMRQDFFEFTPQFKLVIAGNHRPGLRNVDEAMRRRLHLVPFTVTIPPEERDHELTDKLKAEWPAILDLLIEGEVDWIGEGGLHPPEAVRAATDDYLSAEDALAQWIVERCDLGADWRSTTAALFASWKGWAEQASEAVGSQKRFVQALLGRSALGLEPWREGGTGRSGVRGIRLRAGRDDSDLLDRGEPR